MKVYGFPIFFNYVSYDRKLLVTGGLYNEEGELLVSVSGIGLDGFEEKAKKMCKVKNYELEYSKQAPQWLIRKIIEVKNAQLSKIG